MESLNGYDPRQICQKHYRYVDDEEVLWRFKTYVAAATGGALSAACAISYENYQLSTLALVTFPLIRGIVKGTKRTLMGKVNEGDIPSLEKESLKKSCKEGLKESLEEGVRTGFFAIAGFASTLSFHTFLK